MPEPMKIVFMLIPASALLYLFVKNGSTDRYLIFVVPSLVIVAAYRLQAVRMLSGDIDRRTTLLHLVAIGLVAVLFIPAEVERRAMDPADYNKIAPSVARTADISDVLLKNHVTVLLGDFWIIHTSKFHYDSHSGGSLLKVVPSTLLSKESIGFDRFISKEGWLTSAPDADGDFAYAIRQTAPLLKEHNTDDIVRAALGDYIRSEVVEFNGERIAVYIYSNDVRENLSR